LNPSEHELVPEEAELRLHGVGRPLVVARVDRSDVDRLGNRYSEALHESLEIGWYRDFRRDVVDRQRMDHLDDGSDRDAPELHEGSCARPSEPPTPEAEGSGVVHRADPCLEVEVTEREPVVDGQVRDEPVVQPRPNRDVGSDVDERTDRVTLCQTPRVSELTVGSADVRERDLPRVGVVRRPSEEVVAVEVRRAALGFDPSEVEPRPHLPGDPLVGTAFGEVLVPARPDLDVRVEVLPEDQVEGDPTLNTPIDRKAVLEDVRMLCRNERSEERLLVSLLLRDRGVRTGDDHEGHRHDKHVPHRLVPPLR
tara:strand:- start:10898 stop:11827 length:930 start_codon:yes stop_codon:yes gene_type:complete